MTWVRGSLVLALIVALLGVVAVAAGLERHTRPAVAWYCPAPPVTC